MKTLTILRGCSGSGKSSFAKYIASMSDSYTGIIAADDFFLKDGEYKFDANKLGQAHQDCLNRVESHMKNEDDIIIHNTNTSLKEINPYLELAIKYNYKIFSIIIENRHGGQNIHGVPTETLQKQEQRLRNSIKLI
jgi:predicted kinase